MLEPTSTFLGIKVTHLVAGVLGGAVRGFLVGGGWAEAFISVFVGGVTAAYFTTPLTQSPMNYWMIPEGTVGFLVGLTSMLLCEGILKYAKAWSRKPNFPGSAP